MENVATGGSKIGELGKVGKKTNFEEHRDERSRIEKVGKVGPSENSKTYEERKDQNEEKLCKSIMKGFARRKREKHALLAEIEE